MILTVRGICISIALYLDRYIYNTIGVSSSQIPDAVEAELYIRKKHVKPRQQSFGGS